MTEKNHSNTSVHPTAVVHPKAVIPGNVCIGPYSVIDEHVELGQACCIGPQVHLTGWTRIGRNNRFHAGCVIGDAPQDLKYQDNPTELIIGDDNVFREQVTIHRSNKPDDSTRIGNGNFFMVNSHVGHNSLIGNQVIVANGALIGGHVQVDDGVFISGNCLVHQFVRIGSLALMQGGAAVSQDLPPFTLATGDNGICGLNVIGIRRAGFDQKERLKLKRLYRELFLQGKSPIRVAETIQKRISSPHEKQLIQFVLESERGICPHIPRKRR
ncbi:MAG TPA: acyl-ACP--UDP-N-acetylglucosamine O-acyltransferase [Verrucomicrobiales bacterium]|jgi:UDP-N-acetylglucosamine acyltransferase|nr:acyl-ACP--UDP-N-acetylglucosamine O-acyltransferase [Verrucomicrobiales bacterium]